MNQGICLLKFLYFLNWQFLKNIPMSLIKIILIWIFNESWSHIWGGADIKLPMEKTCFWGWWIFSWALAPTWSRQMAPLSLDKISYIGFNVVFACGPVAVASDTGDFSSLYSLLFRPLAGQWSPDCRRRIPVLTGKSGSMSIIVKKVIRFPCRLHRNHPLAAWGVKSPLGRKRSGREAFFGPLTLRWCRRRR